MICDDQSTQRVGTDAMLLGAWTDPQNAESILDIGTGCGVLALMLAQKSSATIDAIDIDKQSVEQAACNFQNSPWKDRMNAIHRSWQTFHENTRNRYDLIITNPPYFSQSLKSPVFRKNLARHNSSLTWSEILRGADRIMTLKGRLSLILPNDELISTIQPALDGKLFLRRETLVLPKPSGKANRVLLEFAREQPEKVSSTTLIILDDQNHFSSSYLQMTKDFHRFRSLPQSAP